MRDRCTGSSLAGGRIVRTEADARENDQRGTCMSDDELQPVDDHEDANQESALANLRDVGERLPSYAKLSMNLVSAGQMSGAQQAQILGPLGYGPASRFTRFVPLLNQVSRILSMVGTIRFVLTQMDVEMANAHLDAVGLSREQVERDFRMMRDLTKRAGDTGAREAGRAFENGARIAGRLTGKGIRSFRNWQARTAARSTDDADQS
jgi:hypothetical protein